MYRKLATTFAAATLLAAVPASAQLIRIGPGSFVPGAPTITFSEQALFTVNPVFNFINIADIGNVSVSFAGAFNGQTVTGTNPRSLSGNPTGPLALNTSVTTSIVNDGANPTTPVLSGSPTYNGPIVMLFSTPVAAVALDGGYFDAVGATTIRGFAADGSVLGSFTNTILGIETYGFADASGNNVISGLAFYITGNEPAGFAIDNVRFAGRSQIIIPSTVPEPSTYALMAAGLAGVLVVARRRRVA